MEAIMDPTMASTTSLQTTDDYIFLDPRASRSPSIKSKRITFSAGTAFVIGGGSYVEYTNLMEWAGRVSTSAVNRRVSYGSTEIVEPDEFLSILRNLAN